MGVQFKITPSVLGLFSFECSALEICNRMSIWSLSGAWSHLQLNKKRQVRWGELPGSSLAQPSPSENLKVTQCKQHYRRQGNARDKPKSGKKLNIN